MLAGMLMEQLHALIEHVLMYQLQFLDNLVVTLIKVTVNTMELPVSLREPAVLMQ
jgi:hypothetical protein